MFHFFTELNTRERVAVSAAGILLVMFIVYSALISPFLEFRGRTRRMIRIQTHQLSEMRQMQGEYRELSARLGHAGVNAATETLFSFLDQAASKAGVKNKVGSMTPGTFVDEATGVKYDKVDVKLQGLDTEALVALLYQLETGRPDVQVARLSITQAGRDQKQIQVDLTVTGQKSSG